MKKQLQVKWLGFGLALAGMVLASGCESGGDSGGVPPPGSSTITGTVTDVEGLSPNASTGFSTVYGGVVRAGVRVRIIGTDLSTTTTEEGLFVISGVPPGDQQLEFSIADILAIKIIDVPENAAVNILDIRIRSGSVDTGKVDVRIRSQSITPNERAVENASPNSRVAEDNRDDDDSSGRSNNRGPGNNNGNNDNSGRSGGDDDSDDDDDDDSSDDDNDEIEVRGSIQSVSGSAITVSGRTFQIRSTTRILDDRNRPVSISAFAVGELAEVEGDMIGGELIARKIKKEDD